MSTDTREALAALPPLPKKRRAMFCTKCGFSGPTEAEASPQGAPCQRCSYTAFVEELDYSDDEMQAYARAALATQPAQPSAQPLLVRDVAEMLGIDSSMPVCKSLVALGYPPRSVNMAVTPDEAVAVAKHLAAQPSAQSEAVALPKAYGTLLESSRYGLEWYRGEPRPGYGGLAVYTAEQVQACVNAVRASAPAAPAQRQEKP